MKNMLINKRSFLFGFFFSVFLCLPFQSFAVKVSSLYQAEIEVPSQTDELKEQAIEDGFLQVLIKVSGDPKIADNPAIKASLQKASYYVQEYSYSLPTTSSSQYTLLIRYEPNDVIRLLKNAGVAYWRETRPLILLWGAIDKKQQTEEAEVISNETSSPWAFTLKEEAKKFGLPLIFPMMDMEDLEEISPQSIVEKDLPALEKAAKRYTPDALLVGKITESKEQMNSEWQLILGNRLAQPEKVWENAKVWEFKLSATNKEELITKMINEVRVIFSKHYEVKPSTESTAWMKLKITHIIEPDDLSRLMQYLKQLTPVQQVRLLQISGDTIEVSVLVRGTKDIFQQNALIGQHLIALPQEMQDGSQMAFEWVH